MSRYYHRWKPSPDQQHRNMYGKPKKAYTTDEEAQAARRDMVRQTGWQFRVYRCDKCKQLHIGKALLGR